MTEPPAVHAEALLATVEAVRFDDLRQPQVGGRIDAVCPFGKLEVPGTAEVVFGAGTANRWKVTTEFLDLPALQMT